MGRTDNDAAIGDVLRSFFEIAAVLLLSLSLGGALAAVSIQNNLGFGALRIGPWTAWPQAGSPHADPYTKAQVAADGNIPLGVAEGVAFHVRQDADGAPLDLTCAYRVEGQTPLARLWTLTAHRLDGPAIRTESGRPATLVSRDVIRKAAGEFKITVGQSLAAGNWIETAGSGPFQLVLRLYDTPISSTSGLTAPTMPDVFLNGCER